MDRIFRAALIGPLVVATALTWPVAAQEPDQNETVRTRARPDYDAVGMRAGGFLLLPSVNVRVAYDDNIFKEDDNAEDADVITSIRPEFRAASQWSNHSLNFAAGADIKVYAADNDENHTDYFGEVDGRFDITRNSNVYGGLFLRELHEPRGNPNSPAASTEPVSYSNVGGNLGFFHKWNRLSLTLEGDRTDISYDNATNRVTGATIIQNDRNRDETELMARLAYEIQPEYEAFIRGRLIDRSYDRLQGTFDRDSDGYELVIGAEIDLTGVVFGDVFVGYRSQDYDDARLRTIDGLTAGATVFWNFTPLTTVTFTLQRSVEESTLGGAAGFFSTTGGVTVDHELLRNLILSAGLSLSNSDYQGATREDDIFSASVGGTYFFNRNLQADFGYRFESRESTTALSDYDNNVVHLDIRVQF